MRRASRGPVDGGTSRAPLSRPGDRSPLLRENRRALPGPRASAPPLRQDLPDASRIRSLRADAHGAATGHRPGAVADGSHARGQQRGAPLRSAAGPAGPAADAACAFADLRGNHAAAVHGLRRLPPRSRVLAAHLAAVRLALHLRQRRPAVVPHRAPLLPAAQCAALPGPRVLVRVRAAAAGAPGHDRRVGCAPVEPQGAGGGLRRRCRRGGRRPRAPWRRRLRAGGLLSVGAR